MNKQDQDYVDSAVELALQMLRHFYDIEDAEAIQLAKDSLSRIEAKKEETRQVFDNLIGREEWQEPLDNLTIR